MYDYIDPRTLLLSSEDLKKSQETWFNCKPPILEFVEGSHGHICGGELSGIAYFGFFAFLGFIVAACAPLPAPEFSACLPAHPEDVFNDLPYQGHA